MSLEALSARTTLADFGWSARADIPRATNSTSLLSSSNANETRRSSASVPVQAPLESFFSCGTAQKRLRLGITSAVHSSETIEPSEVPATAACTVTSERTTSQAGPRTSAFRGITVALEPRVEVYLSQTTVTGGGSNNRPDIAKELDGAETTFADLPEESKERKEVEATYQQRKRWQNDHVNHAVPSVDCLRIVTLTDDGLPLCVNCLAIRRLNHFKSALRREPIALSQRIH